MELILKVIYICIETLILALMTAKLSYKEQKEKREQEIVDKYNLHMFGSCSATEAEKLVMEEFGIFSRSTVWAIRRRVDKRNTKK